MDKNKVLEVAAAARTPSSNPAPQAGYVSGFTSQSELKSKLGWDDMRLKPVLQVGASLTWRALVCKVHNLNSTAHTSYSFSVATEPSSSLFAGLLPAAGQQAPIPSMLPS